MTRALFLCLLFAGSLVAQDSPLVAAAKRTNRSKPKSKIVITNDTLSKSGGHVSTSNEAQPPINLPKETPKQEQQQQKPQVTQTQPAQNAAPKPESSVPLKVEEAAKLHEATAEDEWLSQHPKDPQIHLLPKGMAVDPKTGEKRDTDQPPPKPKP